MTPQEIAAAAIKVIQEKGWSKGRGRTASGAVCAGFALGDAAGFRWTVNTRCVDPDYSAAVEEALVIVDDLFPGRSYRGASRCIPWFNDHPDTTEADVLLVLKHLAES